MIKVLSLINIIKWRKAVDSGGLLVEVWKVLRRNEINMWLVKLFKRIMSERKIPDVWRKSYLVLIYKNKAGVHVCRNYKDIKLTSHTIKLWKRILDKRLK